MIPLQQLKAESSRRHLHEFLRTYAWPVLFPATPFKDNWHIGAICEHLEAIQSGEIKKLIINIPFRHLKSTIISQTFPAWDWITNPHLQYLTGSYNKDLATRDAVNTRRIIESEAYQRDFGHTFQMTSDQNVKTRYDNDHNGSRTVTSTDGAATGFGGNRRIIDDPISSKEADSLPAINSSIEWWKGTMATRGNDPETDTTVLTHQRVNERDLTGYILAEEAGWEHLVLPLRYEAEFKQKPTKIGFVDQRHKEGELLHPERLGETAANDLAKSLGAYHTNAQLQQRPESRGGTIFLRDNWKFYKVLPTIDEIALSVDCTFKDTKSSDYVALQAWARRGADKFLLYRIRERMGFGATVIALRALKEKFPTAVAVLVEDKANGSAVIETLQKEIAGIIPVNPEGGKVARAYAIQPEHEAGNLWLPDPSIEAGADIETYLTELSAFPNPAFHDDEVDSTTQCINWFRNRSASMGIFDYYRQQAEALKKKAA